MADNLVVTTDAKANVQPNNVRSKQRIAGMVALIIALSRMIAGAGMGSVYNTRVKAGDEASTIRSI
jgi:phage terminase large subunit-like protein